LREGYHEESNQATANRLQAVTSLYRLNVIMKNPTRPQQTELPLDLGTEGPLEPVEVTDGELARTVAAQRERGLWVWAMDIRRGSYLLHLRRAPDPDTPPLRKAPIDENLDRLR